jgi:hypothetical protein
MKIRKAVLLVGSGKPSGGSTSEVLGRALLDRMAERGVSTTVLYVTRSVTRPDRELQDALADADLFLLATPLYVDSLPYLVTRTLETLAAEPRPPRRRCGFAVVINCGFPEAEHCQVALSIAEAFARRARFAWAGGLAVPEGGAIDGRPLDTLGRLTRRVREALNLAAAALAAGRPVPPGAIELAAQRMMPARLYTVAGNYRWRKMAARNNATSQLAARPFATG